MASLDEVMKKTVARKRQYQEINDIFTSLRTLDFKDFHIANFKGKPREVETYLVLKLGVRGFTVWRDYVSCIPEAAEKFFLPTFVNVLGKFCEKDNITDEETKHCISLTRICTNVKNEHIAHKDELMKAGAVVNHPTSKVLAPPVQRCVCKRVLSLHNKPSTATSFDFEGAHPTTKITLKCQRCKLYYGYAMYGNQIEGYKYYEDQRPYLQCSNETYIARELCALQVALTLHSQVSFEGFAEAYNEFVRTATPCQYIAMGNQLKTGKSTEQMQYMGTAERKIMSKAFYHNEVQNEMKERKMVWTFKGNAEDDLDDFMDWVERERSNELYQHENCSDACKRRGCESFTVLDGVWKLRHPHCMWPVTVKAKNFPGLNMPDVCTNEPTSQTSAFCKQHVEYAASKHVPTGLREFLKYFCGIEEKTSEDIQEPQVRNIEDAAKVEEMIQTLPQNNEDEGEDQLAKAQGTTGVIALAQTENATKDIDADVDDMPSLEDTCNKDTGDNQKVLRKWSRGLLHFVRGGGHIEKWSPLYKSESPSQVLLITIQYLYQRLQHKDPGTWNELGICYDNMCNLENLKAAAKPLSLPKPFDQLWLSVSKYIDDLHIRNHKRPQCKELYSTAKLRDTIPDLNTPVCEQTFVWASKFKKIMCAMPKRRFLFFYHRMVTRRNAYTEYCYAVNKKPLLPSSRKQKCWKS